MTSECRLTVHLWKEWREHRAALCAALGAIALLALAAAFLAPVRTVVTWATFGLVTLALASGIAVLAGDLVPGEQRRGQLPFVLRAPGALRTAFTAKMIVLFGGTAGLTAIAWSLGEASAGIASMRAPADQYADFVQRTEAVAWIIAGVAIALPWAFAVSCCTSSGASVVPVTVFVLGLLVAPPVLVGAQTALPVASWDAAALAALLFLVGLVAAWAACVRGLRFGRRVHAIARATAVAALFALPSVGWCIDRVRTWHHVDPTDAAVRIGSAVLGEGRAFLGLKCGQNGPGYMVAVDLRTGQWRQLGDVQSWPAAVGDLEDCRHATNPLAPQRWVVRWQFDAAGHRVVGTTVHDGSTGATLGESSGRRLPEALRGALASNAPRSPAFRLPNGDRVWTENRTVVFESTDGRREALPWPEGMHPSSMAGFGFRWCRGQRSTNEMLDLVSRRTVAVPKDFGWPVVVRPGSWALCGRPARTPGFDRLDADTGIRTPFALETGQRVAGPAGDGRLVVSGPAGAFLLDPDRGTREELTCDDGTPIAVIGPPSWGSAGWLAQTPGGADVYWVSLATGSRPHPTSVARRDGARLVLTARADGSVDVVAIPDEDHVLVIRDRRTLERWRFGSEEVEVLFEVGEGGGNRLPKLQPEPVR